MVYIAYIFCIQIHTKIIRYLMAYGGIFSKCFSTYIYCTKYDEINISHSCVQKHVLYTGSHKRFFMYYRLFLETAGDVFSFVFHGLFLLYYILMHFMMCMHVKYVIQCYLKIIEYFDSC